MATYVILNLAEETGTGSGVTKKVKDAILAHGKKSVTTGKWLFKKTRIIQQNTVHKFDLVEKFDRTKVGSRFGLDIKDVNEMKLACDGADAVFLCAHGSATDRNQVFTQRGEIGSSRVEMLATVAEFTSFARMALSTEKTHDLKLIVCFAARSVNPDKRHTKAFLSGSQNNYQALKSSLAYKLYKDLDDNNVHTKMTARLGEVRVSATQAFEMEILTQTEGAVLAGLQLGQASADEQRFGNGISNIRKAELKIYINMGTEEFGPKTDAESSWIEAFKLTTSLNQKKSEEAQLTETGRLTYQREGVTLIISFEGGELYRGAIF